MKSYKGKLNAINNRLDKVSPGWTAAPFVPTMTREELRTRWQTLLTGICDRLATSPDQDDREAAPRFQAMLDRYQVEPDMTNPFNFTRENLTRL